MFPTLDLGIIRIPMYVLMIMVGAIAYILTMYFALYKTEKIKSATFKRVFVVSLVGGAVLYGSAFFFNSLFHSIKAGELKIGGITWLGGVVGAFPVTIYLIHRFVPAAKGNALTYFSILVPGIVIAHAFGRLGCYFAGCCYGGLTDSIFGVSFPSTSHAAHQYPGGPNGGSLPVLPTQLFEAVFELVLFAVMIIFYKKLRKHNVELYAFAYGLFRFLMEFLRGDNRGSSGFFLTPAQLLCVLMWVAAVFLILFKKNKVFKNLKRKCDVWQAEVKLEAIRRRKEYGAKASLNAMEALRELKKLLDEGIINEDEYAEKKEKIMKSM